MNERIRELAEQAGFFPPEITQVGPSVEKFALLIVRECLSQVDKVDAMLDDDKEKTGVAWVGLAIAKHFRVEE
jgi:hypothetical protein